ncbi:uncharacterized protein LOC134684809 [Mytilus trossulus]|uniref:uncharacterized protein LOC134684809 n=1 Tax=Mytilus trossulus TaxID=6551 RepID=UPI0030053E42
MTQTAPQWCTECEETLCSECTEAHKVQKMSRSHHLVEICKLPKNIHLSNNCSMHQQLPLDYFCVDHDIVCCKECLPKYHRVCKNITSIDFASKSSKQSDTFLFFKDQLCLILETLDRLNTNRKENLSRIEQEEIQIRNQIAKTKENIIQRLESLEESLIYQLTELKSKDVTDIKRQEKDIGDLVASTKAQKEVLEFIRDHGSEKQAFISIYSSKPILDVIENKVKELTESCVDTSLWFVESVSIENLTDLGSIEWKYTPSSVSIDAYKQRQSQAPIVLKRQVTSITHLFDIDPKEEKLEGVTGITISDNNTLIFCDVIKKRLFFCDENDTYLSSISCPYDPCDISAIPQTTTAVVSCAYNSYILFVDIDGRKISKQLQLKQKRTDGVSATKDEIFVGAKGKIHVLDVCGNFKRTINAQTVEHCPALISVCSNRNICYSFNHEIYCITSNGNTVFTYTSPNLRQSRDIQIDDVDNIYVLGRDSQNIHQLRSSGTLEDILLKDYVYKPLAFCYNKKQSKIYIANNDGKTISVFKTK